MQARCAIKCPRLLAALSIDPSASSQQRALGTYHPSHDCRLRTSTQRALSGLNASDPLLSALSLTLRLSWTMQASSDPIFRDITVSVT